MDNSNLGKPNLTIKELNEFLQNPNHNITYPCSNWDRLIILVNDIRRTEVGVQYLIKQNQKVRKKCMAIMLDKAIPDFQRLKQMMDIAKVDMIIEALQWTLGNQVAPELSGWDYQFGYGWQRRARVLVLNQDWENPFWYKSYSTFIKPSKAEGKQVVVSKDDHSLPHVTKSVNQVNLNPLEDMLVIEIDGNLKPHKWEDLPTFWNSRDNEIGVNAQLLMDLTEDRKNKLRSDGKLHKSFGKNGDPSKQISSLSNALDGLVMAEDEQNRTSPKRWFTKSSHREPTWKPRFRVNPSIKEPLMDFIEDVQNGKPVLDSAIDWHDSNAPQTHSTKGNKLANEYYSDLTIPTEKIDTLMDIEIDDKKSDDFLD